MSSVTHQAIEGCLLGTAVGDALGLPYEGLSKRRAARLLGPPDRYRFAFRRGFVSDDTEHACMVMQSVIASGEDVSAFERQMVKRLRWWFAGLPAGVGKATALACLKLWFGFSPKRSGVFSAGNGPAMRSAILGVIFDDPDQAVRWVKASSRITHTDPLVEQGAICVALAAHFASRQENVRIEVFLQSIQRVLTDIDNSLLDLLEQLKSSLLQEQSTEEFATSIGCQQGVSGFVLHTVPVVLHAWICHQHDYEQAVRSVIACGGDADTTAAIVGAIAGASVGPEGIPRKWTDGLSEWPRTVGWMKRLAAQLHRHCRAGFVVEKPLRLNPLAVLIRNVVFLVIVLTHGFRRLLPPY